MLSEQYDNLPGENKGLKVAEERELKIIINGKERRNWGLEKNKQSDK